MHNKRILAVLVMSCFLVSSSCSLLPRSWRRKTHFTSEELKSENPIHQVRAIHEIVDSRDTHQVPVLLDLMLGEEPSVRNHAYWGVTQLTGIDRPENSRADYHYYDSLEERESAVASWRTYWKGKSAE